MLIAIAVSGCTLGQSQPSAMDGGSDAAISSDAAPHDPGPMPVGRCGTPGVLRSPLQPDLAGMGFSTSAFNGGSVAVDAGRLALRLGSPTGAMYRSARAGSRGTFDLTETAIEVAVVEVPVGTDVLTQLRVGVASIQVLNGELSAKITGVPGGDKLKTVAYDANAHRIWRVRDQANTLILETSPDRTQWTELLSIPSPPAVRAAGLSMFLGAPPQAGVRQAIFAELNQGALPASWCKASALRDDFSAGIADSTWVDAASDDTRCFPTGLGGDVVFSTPALVEACGSLMYSRTVFDLRNSVAELVSKPIALYRPGWQPYLEVQAARRTFVLNFEDNKMCARDSATSNAPCVPYDGARYWRFAHDGNALAWQVSKDRTTWMTIRSEVIGDELASVRVQIGTRRTGASDTALEFRVSDYNPM